MAITVMPSLFPSSCTRTTNSISYDLPARGQRYGLTTFLIYHTTGLGFAYLPGAVVATCSKTTVKHPASFTFWLMPVSRFGIYIVDDIY